ncbi:MAG: FAD-binding protein [Paracoccaceae bacterium]
MMPKTEADLSQAIRSASGPLAITGGGTRGMTVQGAPLCTRGLSGITLYDPGALTMVAGAGTPLAEIEAALAAEAQMLAFEPYDLASLTGAQGASTIGGVFATNASGPRRVQVGAARDFLLGVRFVDGAGEIVKNGGRVMKNVTGYDLVKLMAGAHGTLGVLSEVSFKTLPRPEASATLRISGLDPARAVAAMSAAMGTPYDVSGAAHLEAGGGQTVLRLEGFEGSVAYRARALREALAPFGDAAHCEGAVWSGLRDLSALGAAEQIWRAALRPSDAPAFVARLRALGGGAEARVMMDWSGGRMWIGASAGAGGAALHRALQELGAQMRGHVTLIHSGAPLEGPRFQPEAAGVARISAALRRKFDPRGLLNAGLMG